MSALAWVILAALAVAGIGIILGRIITGDRLRAMDITGLHEQILVDRWCAAHAHAYKIVPTPTVWRCANCGDVVESKPGWVGAKP